MKTTFSQTELFVVCNLYDTPTFLFEMQTAESAQERVDRNSKHNDDVTQYAFMPVYHYVQAMCGGYENLLEAYNAYHSD